MLSEVGRLPNDDRLIREQQTEENTAELRLRLAAGGQSGNTVVQRSLPAVSQLYGAEVSWEVGSTALARALGTAAADRRRDSGQPDRGAAYGRGARARTSRGGS